MSEIEKLVAGVNASVDEIKTKQTEIKSSLEKSISATGKDASDAIALANKTAEEIEKISANVLEMQQEMSANVQSGKTTPDTLGDMIVKSEDFTRFVNGNTQKLTIQANTIIGQDGSGNSDSTLVQSDRMSGIVPGAFRSLRVTDVLNTGTTDSNAYEFTREASFVNNAAPTAEGATKPESDLTFELISLPVRTIAHTIKASKQIIADAPALRSYIDTRMRYGAELEREKQILNGDGAGQNLSGITLAGNHSAFTPDAGTKALDNLNAMIENVGLADYASTAIIMNTSDWHAIERLKVGGTSDERYVVGNPTGVINRVLWGLPVVVTNSIAAGKAVVGQLDMAYQVMNREGVKVEMFEQDEANVQQNLLTIRAESRAMLATYVPAAVQYGDLVAA